jgi:hypothetical protein
LKDAATRVLQRFARRVPALARAKWRRRLRALRHRRAAKRLHARLAAVHTAQAPALADLAHIQAAAAAAQQELQRALAAVETRLEARWRDDQPHILSRALKVSWRCHEWGRQPG